MGRRTHLVVGGLASALLLLAGVLSGLTRDRIVAPPRPQVELPRPAPPKVTRLQSPATVEPDPATPPPAPPGEALAPALAREIEALRTLEVEPLPDEEEDETFARLNTLRGERYGVLVRQLEAAATDSASRTAALRALAEVHTLVGDSVLQRPVAAALAGEQALHDADVGAAAAHRFYGRADAALAALEAEGRGDPVELRAQREALRAR